MHLYIDVQNYVNSFHISLCYTISTFWLAHNIQIHLWLEGAQTSWLSRPSTSDLADISHCDTVYGIRTVVLTFLWHNIIDWNQIGMRHMLKESKSSRAKNRPLPKAKGKAKAKAAARKGKKPKGRGVPNEKPPSKRFRAKASDAAVAEPSTVRTHRGKRTKKAKNAWAATAAVARILINEHGILYMAQANHILDVISFEHIDFYLIFDCYVAIAANGWHGIWRHVGNHMSRNLGKSWRLSIFKSADILGTDHVISYDPLDWPYGSGCTMLVLVPVQSKLSDVWLSPQAVWKKVRLWVVGVQCSSAITCLHPSWQWGFKNIHKQKTHHAIIQPCVLWKSFLPCLPCLPACQDLPTRPSNWLGGTAVEMLGIPWQHGFKGLTQVFVTDLRYIFYCQSELVSCIRNSPYIGLFSPEISELTDRHHILSAIMHDWKIGIPLGSGIVWLTWHSCQEPAREILKFATASCRDDEQEGRLTGRCPVLLALANKNPKKSDSSLNCWTYRFGPHNLLYSNVPTAPLKE